MIVVKVELWPGGHEDRKRELGRMHLTNQGTGTRERGNYAVKLMRRGTVDVVQRTTDIENYPRQSYPVWELVRRALQKLYGKE